MNPAVLRMSETIRAKLTMKPKEMARAQMGTALAHRERVTGSPVHAGTVDPVTKARRRAQNKRARQARAMHRRKG